MSSCKVGLLVAALWAMPALAGEIRGTIRYAGPAPAARPLPVDRDQATCGQSSGDEALMVSGGKLQNVVVTVKGVPGWKPEPKAVTLDQKQCRYVPHVQAASAGSTLRILNSDPVFHNVHAYQGAKPSFNVAMPIRNMKRDVKLERPGVMHVKCDVHGWMSAYVVVTEGPSAVTAGDGVFVIPDLPAGTYDVTAWHEKLGEQTVKVTVPAAGRGAADFTFGR